MDKEIKESLTASETWVRGLYMLLFLLIYTVVEIVIGVVVILQFLFLLFTREPNERLLEFGDDMTVYIYQIWQFLTVNSEEKPFPFAPWPSSTEDLAVMVDDDDIVTDEEVAKTEAKAAGGPVAEGDRTPAGPGMVDDEQAGGVSSAGDENVTDGDAKPTGPGLTDDPERKPD